MRPVYLRRTRPCAHRLRPLDGLALALGYGLLLSMCIAAIIGIVDWVQGSPQTVWPQIAALLSLLDGSTK